MQKSEYFLFHIVHEDWSKRGKLFLFFISKRQFCILYIPSVPESIWLKYVKITSLRYRFCKKMVFTYKSKKSTTRNFKIDKIYGNRIDEKCFFFIWKEILSFRFPRFFCCCSWFHKSFFTFTLYNPKGSVKIIWTLLKKFKLISVLVTNLMFIMLD